MKEIKKLVFVFTAACLGGCGTINNTIVGTPPAPPHEYTPPLEIYGGVKWDIQDVWDSVTAVPSTSIIENSIRFVDTAITLADVPLSFVGDTLTLWMTIPASLEKREDDQ